MNAIEKLFNGPFLRQLDNIIRWQEIDVFNKESVSSHSYQVVVFTRVLLHDIFHGYSNLVIDQYIKQCVDHAMFHDFDEALIRRDISHVIKYNEYNGENIRKGLDNLVYHLACQEFNFSSGAFLIENVTTPVPQVKRLVKFCDWLAMAFFLRRECKLGNTNLKDECATVYKGVTSSGKELKRVLEEEFGQLADLSVVDNLIKTIYNDEKEFYL